MALIILILIVLAIAAMVYVNRGKSRFQNKSPWQHFFDGVEISSKDFYDRVEGVLRDRKTPNLDFGRESFLESHIFSAKREYLRITHAEYVFFIGAAPFGTGTFISQWLCIKEEKVTEKIPVVSKLAGKDRSDKTFYQIDTQSMYRSAIHSAVMSVLNDITEGKGVRGLTELERTYQYRD